MNFCVKLNCTWSMDLFDWETVKYFFVLCVFFCMRYSVECLCGQSNICQLLQSAFLRASKRVQAVYDTTTWEILYSLSAY